MELRSWIIATQYELRQGRMINNALSLPRQLFIIYYFRDVEDAIPYATRLHFSSFITHYFRDVEGAIPYATMSHFSLFIIYYFRDVVTPSPTSKYLTAINEMRFVILKRIFGASLWA